ncbi:MAG: beta-glucosidase [Armatimonadetes bacterium]|nr:beta-glucosidase [Armatimonadota bacterium]
MSDFPEGFLWGAATAAYQIEGGHDAEGKGPSTWDSFVRQPGKVAHGHTGDVACDHFHRWQEDVGLMRELSLNSYRFSIAWSRILPEGTGEVNQKGLEFYDRLVDALLSAGIRPMATLFHWDLPYALFLQGGWTNPDMPKWFAEYASVVSGRLNDRVKDWFTLNEPGIFLVLGQVEGTHAPGLKGTPYEFFLSLKHAMLAHGAAARVLRATSDVRIGYAPHCIVGTPASDNPADVDAARAYTFGDQNNARRFWQQRLFLDPALSGEWPRDIESALSERAVEISADDLKDMSPQLDFLGLNYYTGEVVQATPNAAYEIVPEPPGSPRTLFDWTISPEGLYWTLRFHSERYGLPMVVSENGVSCMDWVALDGHVHDPQRIDFLGRYLDQLRRAVRDGIDVRGYLHWSLLDNFEWADGYRQRFGLIHVDFQTLKRTIKDSGRWYAQVCTSNGASLPLL